MTAAEMIAELSKHPPGTPVLYVETSDYGKCYLEPELRFSKMLGTERVVLHEFNCDPAVNLSPPYFNAILLDSQ